MTDWMPALFAWLAVGTLGGMHSASRFGGPLLLVAGSHERRPVLSLGSFLTGLIGSYGLWGAAMGTVGHVMMETAAPGLDLGALLPWVGSAGLAAAAPFAARCARERESSVAWVRHLPPFVISLAGRGSFAGKCLLGSAMGLLAGPVLLVFLALAAATASPASGAAAMAVLGLGSTLPHLAYAAGGLDRTVVASPPAPPLWMAEDAVHPPR